MGPGAARAGPRMTPWAVTATIAKSIPPADRVDRGRGLVLGTKPNSAEMSVEQGDSRFLRGQTSFFSEFSERFFLTPSLGSLLPKTVCPLMAGGRTQAMAAPAVRRERHRHAAGAVRGPFRVPSHPRPGLFFLVRANGPNWFLIASPVSRINIEIGFLLGLGRVEPTGDRQGRTGLR